MLEKGKLKTDVLWKILGIVGIVFTCLLVLMATMNKPVADEFSFMTRVDSLGPVGLAADLYQNNSGRLAQALNIGLSYKIFGDMRSQIIVPVLFHLALSATLAWFFYLVFNPKDKKIPKSIAFGLFSSGLILYCAPCLFDAYLWVDSGFVHVCGIISIIFALDTFIWLARTPDFFKKRRTIPLLLFCCYMLLCNEATVAFVVGWAFVCLIGTLFIKKFKHYRPAAITLFSLSVIAFSIMFFAPGTWARVDAESGNAGIFKILISYPIDAIRAIIATWSFWQLLLVVAFGIFVGSIVPFKNNRRWFILASLLVLGTLTYGVLAVVFYGQKYGGIASRTMFTPNLGIIIAIVICVAAAYSYFMDKFCVKVYRRPVIASIIMIFCLACSSIGFLKFNRNLFSVLSIRADLVEKRVLSINEYRSGKTDKLVLPDIPVALARSNASDFTVNNTAYYDWFYDSFALYYHIDEDDLTVIGGDIKSEYWDVTIPDWYIVSGLQFCFSDNPLVDSKYLCSNK